MPSLLVQAKLRNNTYKDRINFDRFQDIHQLKREIMGKFSPLFNSYFPAQLTLFQPDGITEIDKNNQVAILKENRLGPIFATVKEFFIEVRLGNKTYQSQVCAAGCEYVAEVKDAIKTKFSPLLVSYCPAQLTLFQPDGINEIDPETLVSDLKVSPWKPLIVTAEVLSIQVRLGDKTYQDQFCTAGCKNIYQLKDAIKKNFSPLLDSYDLAQLTLFQHDESTEIDPETLVADLKEIPLKPIVVTVKELSTQDRDSFRKEPTHSGMSSEVSCIKYLDAIAKKVSRGYGFNKFGEIPTISDLLAAKDIGYPLFNGEPVYSIFSKEEWNILESMNAYSTRKIHDAKLPQDSSQNPFVIIPDSKFTEEYVRSLKRIAVKAKVVSTDDDLIVKCESDL